MKLLEHQAKAFLSNFKIPIPHGKVALDAEEARRIAQEMESGRWVVKAQVHAGGRGKSGGVVFADTPKGVQEAAEEMLGMRLVTPQTGPHGNPVGSVLVEEGVAVKRAFYVGVTIDHAAQCPVFMVSAEGGVGIEESAAEDPDTILQERVDVTGGLEEPQIRSLLQGMGMDQALLQTGMEIFRQAYSLFVSMDCVLVEINPLVVTEEGRLLAVDAKIEMDDNALYRHGDFSHLRETDEQDPIEREAARHHLRYVPLGGEIGLMANGAGLAMATMDLIKQAGSSPANFLDVGGGATTERISKGFHILLRNKGVKGILLNIFGGILRCDVLAQGVVEASKKTSIHVPVVVRLEGTNKEEGHNILTGCDVDFIIAESIAHAAEEIRRIAS